jgi:uncharacterized protein
MLLAGSFQAECLMTPVVGLGVAPLGVASGATSDSSKAASSSSLPNPAAAYCIEMGGTYRMVDEGTGTRGICTLPDGRAVDAWKFYRDSIKKGA